MSDLPDFLRYTAAANPNPHQRQRLRDAAAEIERLRLTRPVGVVPDPRDHKYLDPKCSTDGCQSLLLRDEIERLRDVAGWAQAVLTALNTGSVVESGSPLHLKLRDVMIGYHEKGGGK